MQKKIVFCLLLANNKFGYRLLQYHLCRLRLSETPQQTVLFLLAVHKQGQRYASTTTRENEKSTTKNAEETVITKRAEETVTAKRAEETVTAKRA